jgi:hypothetical protein
MAQPPKTAPLHQPKFLMLRRHGIKRGKKGLNPKPYHKVATRAGKRDKLDELCRQIVKLRDQCCVVCGTSDDLQCGHYLSRSSWSTRFHLMNCHAQCSTCNKAHEDDPTPYKEFMERTYGADEIAELHRLWHVSRLFSDEDLDKLITEYEETLRLMKEAA